MSVLRLVDLELCSRNLSFLLELRLIAQPLTAVLILPLSENLKSASLVALLRKWKCCNVIWLFLGEYFADSAGKRESWRKVVIMSDYFSFFQALQEEQKGLKASLQSQENFILEAKMQKEKLQTKLKTVDTQHSIESMRSVRILSIILPVHLKPWHWMPILILNIYISVFDHLVWLGFNLWVRFSLS